MPMTFDSYNFCSMGCIYCFAYFFKSQNPSINKDDIHLKAVNYKKLISALNGKEKAGRGKLMHDLFYKDRFLFHWGGLSDPFDAFEKENKIGYHLMKELGELDYPTLFSFKGGTIFEKDYVKLFEKYSKQRNFAFQISMVTYDKEMARNVEIGVPSPEQRLKAIRMLSDMGYWTILRLRPYIIGITDESIDELLEAALEAGIQGVSMEFFAMDVRATEGMKERYAWISKLIGTKDIHQYFKALSPSERGGYMRLNRLVKEEHVKKVYQFCAKHNLVFGCSDPDFKELNTSGSCFSANTKVILKGKHSPYIRQFSLLGAYNAYNKFKTSFKVLNNGKWSEAIPIRIPYTRDWYEITLRNGSKFLTTDDHIHFTKDGNKITSDLKTGDFLLFGNTKMKSDSNRGTFNLGRFIGLYIAEGSRVFTSKKGQFSFTFNSKEREYINFIKEFSSSFGGYFSEKTRISNRTKTINNYTGVGVYSRLLKAVISEFISGSYSKSKRLKSICLEMSDDFRLGLLTGWSEGDGRYNKRKFLGGNSSSEGLIKDLYEISISLGLLPSFNKTKRKTGILRLPNGEITNVPAKKNSYYYSLKIHSTKITNENRKRIVYFTDKIYQQKFHSIKGKIYTQIISIKKRNINRSKFAYCLIVPNGHRFQLANGVITHNCCGMPDTYKPNRGLENWTRNQLTYHLKEARKEYHTKGTIRKLYFKDVYPTGVSYLENTSITNDHIKVTQMTNAERYSHTYRTMIQGTWNNLRSPANPRNYFHGKLMPCGVDEEDNLIFKYEPMEYESRWKNEKIDLLR